MKEGGRLEALPSHPQREKRSNGPREAYTHTLERERTQLKREGVFFLKGLSTSLELLGKRKK